ncbi:MAG: Gfo/Idh/MocA family oxidoreductase [Bacteroidota bacterium]|jgi:predicted dehydrogenase
MNSENVITRREFVASTAKAAAGAVLLNQMPGIVTSRTLASKRKLAMVGTGHRGTGMWGTSVLKDYGDLVEFVGLCDINPGRAETAKQMLGVSCPTFKDFEEMVRTTKPETVIVTTVDGTHHMFIAKALEMGCDVITEKPLTTSESKLKVILDAQRKSANKIIVAHNYRYPPTAAKMKELLMQERVGRITSVDFHWYLDVYHGADYFRRWHRLRQNSGTLLNHKASHHFDMLNWWVDSDPEEVHAFGALEFYGKNHEFRHTHCRPCPFKEKCQFYFDMTKDQRLMRLYADNEKYDGYTRDGCVWKEDIDIFDKMAVQIRYANKVQVSYSLTTYSPYEGYRIAFNGTRGRIDFWMHERQPWPMDNFDEIHVTDSFGKAEFIKLPRIEEDHYGGDPLMKDKIFRNPAAPDPFHQAANVRDGAMAVVIGVAARNSIDSGKPVRIADLTDIVPQAKKPD